MPTSDVGNDDDDDVHDSEDGDKEIDDERFFSGRKEANFFR